jgi:two-component system response regulator LytT
MDALEIKKLLKDWIPPEASIAIANKVQYVNYISGIHDIKIQPGQPIPSGSVAERVIQQRDRIELIVHESVFGIPYYGIGYPIESRTGFQGALTVILPPSYTLEKASPLTYITGKQGEFWTPTPVEEIAYIESHQKKTWFYTINGKYSTIQTLKELEERLPDKFIRVHRSFIVNIMFIQHLYRDLTSNLILKLKIPDTPELTVSQTYVPNVRRILEF